MRVGIPVDGMHYIRTYTISSPPERDDGCITITRMSFLGGSVEQKIARA